MAKTGIYKIGFLDYDEESDIWQQHEVDIEIPAERSGFAGLVETHWFSAFDQKQASLNEELVEDETGIHFVTTLDFAVRRDSDIALAKKYMRRPVVIRAIAVDQTEYKIGSKSYPVRMKTNNKYDGIDSREIHIFVEYQSRTGVMMKG